MAESSQARQLFNRQRFGSDSALSSWPQSSCKRRRRWKAAPKGKHDLVKLDHQQGGENIKTFAIDALAWWIVVKKSMPVHLFLFLLCGGQNDTFGFGHSHKPWSGLLCLFFRPIDLLFFFFLNVFHLSCTFSLDHFLFVGPTKLKCQLLHIFNWTSQVGYFFLSCLSLFISANQVWMQTLHAWTSRKSVMSSTLCLSHIDSEGNERSRLRSHPQRSETSVLNCTKLQLWKYPSKVKPAPAQILTLLRARLAPVTKIESCASD